MKHSSLSSGFIGISSFSMPYSSQKIESSLIDESNSANTASDTNFINQNVTRYYTKDEVSKHSTKSDFWTIFRDKVYDLTSFWKSHPGGDIILEAAGKDSTLLFEDIGHSQDAELLLKKYYIGELKS